MITNREEVIDKAFKVFLRMNYEKASISTLAKACGVVKTGVVYYFPHKLDLFMAVADKYAIQMQTPANKFAGPTDTLAGFIEQYVAIFRKEHELWRTVIQKAKDSGEIKQDTDVKKTAPLFRQVFLGMSYEQSFLNGLDVEELKEKFDCLYSLLKA